MAPAVSGLITVSDRAYSRFEVASALNPLNDLAKARAQQAAKTEQVVESGISWDYISRKEEQEAVVGMGSVRAQEWKRLTI